ncbi:MAG TPA: hypothetical protein VH207_07225 [Chthoniobacterales bacterium]|jgi:hypothetical protein|nr:hypothetical protein [Chthoniobacterales bacterium]
MRTRRKDKLWLWIGIVLGAFVIVVAIATAILNPAITRYVEGPKFRAEIEKETAKGLHFRESEFAPIHRTGFLSAASDWAKADQGEKALTKLRAHGITARFNPLGVFLRRWQLDDIHVDGGEVAIQVYEPKPESTPGKPWYHVFLPDRVYLRQLRSEPVDVTWTLLSKKSGFFGTRLLITPHGRDFEYQATGGTMRMPHAPALQLRHTHLLITKTLISLYQLDLVSGAGTIHGEGKAGTRDDKSVDCRVTFDKLPIREWVPESWRQHVDGAARGKAHWSGQDWKLADAEVQGSLQIDGARIRGLRVLEVLAAVAKHKSLENLELSDFSADVELKQGVAAARHIAIEAKGKFRIEGSVTLHKDSLGGSLDLGATPEYLEWLPDARGIFSREHDGYLWTTVHLSGTLENPQQDLSPRVFAAMKESPGAWFSAALRALGAWLRGE